MATAKMVLIGIILAIVITEIELRPRIGFTREGKMLLWYGKRNRKFIVLF